MSLDDVNRKKAPRRTIVSVEREGAWGRVEYAHLLDCGHIEKRKRPAKTDYISCAWCVIAEEQDKEMRLLPTAVSKEVPVDDDLMDPMGTFLASSEKALASLRGDLARRFDVPVDYVDVVTIDEDGELKISYAVVFIPAGDIPFILQTGSSQNNQ